MNNPVKTKQFKVLYPTYHDFKTKVLDKVISLHPDLPSYLDDDKMVYNNEFLFSILRNKYEDFFAANDDERQHKLMINAVQQLYPAVYVKSLSLSNLALDSLDISSMLKNIERVYNENPALNHYVKTRENDNKKFNEDPDKNYSSTENVMSSTPMDDTNNLFGLTNPKEKDISRTKDKTINIDENKNKETVIDATIKVKEISNLISKYSKMKNLSVSGLVNLFLNDYTMSSLWIIGDSQTVQVMEMDDAYIEEVVKQYLIDNPVKVDPKTIDITAPGQSTGLIVPPQTENLDEWVNILHNDAYTTKIYLVGENKLSLTPEEKADISSKKESILSVILKRVVNFTGKEPGEYIIELNKDGLPIPIPYKGGGVGDETRIFTSGTSGSTGLLKRTLVSFDGTTQKDEILSDRDAIQINQSVYTGSDTKLTKAYFGIKDLTKDDAIHFIYTVDEDGEHSILSRDKFFAYNLFCELKKTVYIGLNNTGALHIGTGNVGALTFAYGITKKATIGENALGTIEIGSKLAGTAQAPNGKGRLIHGKKDCLFEEIIDMVNNGDPSSGEDIKNINDLGLVLGKAAQTEFSKPPFIIIEELIELNKKKFMDENRFVTKGLLDDELVGIKSDIVVNEKSITEINTKIFDIEKKLDLVGVIKTYRGDVMVDKSNLSDFGKGKRVILPPSFPSITAENHDNLSVFYQGNRLDESRDYTIQGGSIILEQSLFLVSEDENIAYLKFEMVDGSVKGSSGGGSDDLSNILPGYTQNMYYGEGNTASLIYGENANSISIGWKMGGSLDILKDASPSTTAFIGNNNESVGSDNIKLVSGSKSASFENIIDMTNTAKNNFADTILSNVRVQSMEEYNPKENQLLGVKAGKTFFEFLNVSDFTSEIERVIEKSLETVVYKGPGDKIVYNSDGFFRQWNNVAIKYKKTFGIKFVLKKSSVQGGLPINIVGFVDNTKIVNNIPNAPYFSVAVDVSGYAYMYRVGYSSTGEMNVEQWYDGSLYETYNRFGGIEIGGL